MQINCVKETACNYKQKLNNNVQTSTNAALYLQYKEQDSERKEIKSFKPDKNSYFILKKKSLQRNRSLSL